MKTFILSLLSALFLLVSGQVALGEFISWQDKAYDFSRVKTVYVAALDTHEAKLDNALKEKLLSEEFRTKLSAVSKFSYIMEEDAAGEAEEVADETAVSPDSAKEETEKIDENTTAIVKAKTEKPKISKAAAASGADVLLRPILRTYKVTREIVPAHTEWRTHQIDRSWKDKNGNWHKEYQTVSYPVHVPDTYVDHAYISCAFEWYDIQTGKLIAGSEDSRDRRYEDNPIDMYRRIVDRFVKNLKKM